MGNKEYHVQLEKGDIGRYVLLPGDPGRVEKIAEFFDEARKVAQNREYTTYTGTVDGIKISATSTGIGCPGAAICIEELIKCGADTFIRVGTAGGLTEEIEIGDICISTAAVRHEGTTSQYVPEIYPAIANLDVTLALRTAASNLGYRWHCGITHCKDAFYTESADLITPLKEYNENLWKVWARANVISTSMESSAIFVISSIRKVRAGEVLAIIGLTHKHTPIVRKVGVKEAIKVAIEAVKILHKWDTENN